MLDTGTVLEPHHTYNVYRLQRIATKLDITFVKRVYKEPCESRGLQHVEP